MAACGEMIPANSTQNPITAINATAATLLVETAVPTAMKQASDDEQTEVGAEPGAGPSGEVDQEQDGERTEGTEEARLGAGEEQMGEAEHEGHDDRGPHRPLDGQEPRVLFRQPSRGGRP